MRIFFFSETTMTTTDSTAQVKQRLGQLCSVVLLISADKDPTLFLSVRSVQGWLVG